MTETNVDVSPDAGDRARERARSSITELVSETAGPEAIREVPFFPGARTTERRPEPRHGLRAALQLRDAATGHARRFIEELRGAGSSWPAVATEVRRDDELDGADVEAVFDEFAVHGLSTYDRPWMSWRCDTCDERVLDYGPTNPHPVDVEQGHTDDCARHATDIRAHEQQDR